MPLRVDRPMAIGLSISVALSTRPLSQWLAATSGAVRRWRLARVLACLAATAVPARGACCAWLHAWLSRGRRVGVAWKRNVKSIVTRFGLNDGRHDTEIIKLTVKTTPNKLLLSALKRLQCGVAVCELFASSVLPLLRATQNSFGGVLFIKMTMPDQKLTIEAGVALAEAEGLGTRATADRT